MGGAISVLVLGGQEPEAIFSGIDWGTIFFLTAFYVVVGGLQASGVIGVMADGITQILRFEPNFAPALNVWISAVPSSIIDNIPMTLTLIPVMEHVSSLTGISIRILGWAIVFGANLGGNLTPIGSASNIIGLSILRKEGIVIGWSDWIKKVGVFALILIIVATFYVTILGVIL